MTAMSESARGPEVPEAVRLRLVALTAEVLPAVDPLPAPLKRVAAFTPARRARSGGSQIALLLGTDDEFRARVGTQVAAVLPDLAASLDGAHAPDTADPLDLAVLLWLSRPHGWEDAWAAAVARLAERHRHEATRQEAEELERLRLRLAEAEQVLREARGRHKDQVDDLKSENAALRRKLGDTRAAVRAIEESADRARREQDEHSQAARAAAAAAEAEQRRLRARVAELEASATEARRETRTAKDDAGLRARLLLDTMLDAAQGLRRELGLPPTSGAPADRLEAELAAAGVDRAEGAGSSGPSSPALLESYLAMPRVRLIVDGYNVSKTAWPESPLEAQRIRLLGGIAAVVARSGAETTVVFDAASLAARPPVSPPRGVKVVFSPPGVIADDVIRDLVAAEPRGRVVVVVTSDQELVRDVRRAGARSVASDALVGVLSR